MGKGEKRRSINKKIILKFVVINRFKEKITCENRI